MEQNPAHTNRPPSGYERLLDVIEQAVVAVDQNGRITFWNKGAETLFGWSATDALSHDGIELVLPPSERIYARDRLTGLVAGDTWAGDYRFYRRDGTGFWGQVTVGPDRDPTGAVVGVIASVHDTTARKEAEERMRLLEEHRRLAAEASRVYTFERNLVTGEINFADPVVNLTGIPLTSEERRQEYYRHMHPEDVEHVRRAVDGSTVPGGPGSYDIEYRFIRPDGDTRWIHGIGKTIFEGEGKSRKAVRLVGAMTDITDRKRMEEANERREERLRLAVKAAKAFTFERNMVTGSLEFDENMCALTGLPAGSQLNYDEYYSHIHPDDAPKMQENIRRALETDAPTTWEIDYRFIRPDGQVRWFNIHATTFFDGHPRPSRPTRILGMVSDITEIKQAHQAIQRKEARLRFAVETANSFTYERNIASQTYEVDDNAYVLTGFPADTPFERERFYNRINPDDVAMMNGALERALQSPTPVTWETEYRFTRPDGQVRWFNAKAATFFDGGHDRPTRIVGLVSDVTPRRRAEEAQRFLSEATRILASSLDYNETLDRVVDITVPAQADMCGIYLLQPGGQLQLVTLAHRDPAKLDTLRKVTSRLPLPREHVLRQVIETGQSVLIPEVTEEEFAQLVRNKGDEGLVRELQQHSIVAVPLISHGVILGVLNLGTSSDSGRSYDSAHLAMIEELGRRCGTAVDNARLYSRLADSERRLALTLQVSGVGFFERSYPPNDDFYLSQRIGEIVGVSRDQMPSWKDYDTWLTERIHPDDLPAARRASRSFRDGRTKNLLLEFRIRHARGRWRWVRVLSHPTSRDVNGRVTHATGVVMDITSLKHSEQTLREANQELEARVKERTAELEQLTERLRLLASELTSAEQTERRNLAQLIHDDLQQLLVAARIQVSSLEDKEKGEDEMVAARRLAVSLIDDAIEESRSLTAQLRPPALYESGIVPSLGWLADWVKQAHGLNVKLDLDQSAGQLPEQEAVLLFDSVRELLLNVVKYAGASEATLSLHQVGNTWLRITVADAGRGFDTSILDTPRTGGGGLGLFSIRERMIVAGGRLEMHSTPGKGTTAELLWPITSNGAAAAPAYAGPEPRMELRQRSREVGTATQPTGLITVLLADDHALVRQGIASVLSAQPDIAVIAEAADGAEAVQAVEMYRPQVVVMDVNMPKLNGVQACRIIKEKFPGVRLIGLSIHNDQAVRDSMLNAGASAYMSKDAPAENLLAALRV